MQKTISITSRGQLHIPKIMREKLHLNNVKTVLVKVEGNKLIIEPKRDELLSIIGALTGSKPLIPDFSIDKLREYVDYSRE